MQNKSAANIVSKIINYPLLLINFIVEGSLGVLMVFNPAFIKYFGGVSISYILLRTCGVLALSIAFFSITSIIFIYSQKDKQSIKTFVYSNLFIFNLALTIGLLYAAIVGEITYLGVVVHLPLAACFAVALISNSYKTSQK